MFQLRETYLQFPYLFS